MPIVLVLCCRLTPSEVVAVLLYTIGADVVCRPLCLAGQSKVNPFTAAGDAVRRCSTYSHFAYGRYITSVQRPTRYRGGALALACYFSVDIDRCHNRIAATPVDTSVVGIYRKHSSFDLLRAVYLKAYPRGREVNACHKLHFAADGTDGKAHISFSIGYFPTR